MSLGDCFTLSKRSVSKKAVLSDRLFFENNVGVRIIECQQSGLVNQSSTETKPVNGFSYILLGRGGPQCLRAVALERASVAAS